jgi:hypothetical protein
MKALISPNEIFTWSWISSWQEQVVNNVTIWEPIYSEILNCQRVAQVESDDKIFPVYHTLIWIDCPEDCVADEWYFKDNQVQPKPQDEPRPATPVEVLP